MRISAAVDNPVRCGVTENRSVINQECPNIEPDDHRRVETRPTIGSRHSWHRCCAKNFPLSHNQISSHRI